MHRMNGYDWEPPTAAEMAVWEAQAAEFERLAAEHAEERFTGRSDSGLVEAEVDGNGRLIDLDVSPDALRQAYPQNIGPDTIEAIAAARAAAGAAGREKAAELFPGVFA
ncbi:YbaB/EbfC family nucleoid-associated protein [Amycolatopsis pittospori]|uniref:YbaB/EbfC family nucleoid-associated protein n=1 Tax=Amycolatopsis pittospori TaxID=2749434 RepID=UPI001F29094A|nr:YbaB/EbfC family nucleoid-associated protein [Amycolatopsis pittospori]